MAKGLPAAFVALVVGGIAAYVAWRQYETARAKLKLDLFERRLAIFELTWSVLSDAVREPRTPPNMNINISLHNKGPETRFLFGQSMAEYVENVCNKHTSLAMAEMGIQHEDSLTKEHEISQLLDWFKHEAKTGARLKFSSYLDFEKWR